MKAYDIVKEAPFVPIIYGPGYEAYARQAAFSIEEEGLPYQLISGGTKTSALSAELIIKGKKAIIHETKHDLCVMSFDTETTDPRKAGKNTALFILGKPLEI